MSSITPEQWTNLASAWQLSAEAIRILRKDNPWQQRARLLQTWWGRTQLGNATERDRPWRLADRTGAGGANFLSSLIADEVDRALTEEFREQGAVIEVGRLRTNLLASQPLCFNAFGELSAPGQQEVATQVMSRMWPEMVGRVERIRYEHNPRRGEGGPTGTSSAFDVFVDVTTPAGHPGFIGIEVKYHENLDGKVPTTSRKTTEATAARISSLESAAARVGAPLASVLQPRIHQVWLDHSLALALLDPTVQRDLGLPQYQTGAFVMLSPSHNQVVEQGFEDYQQAISMPESALGTLRFLTLEDFVDALGSALPELADRLATRYLNLDPVNQALSGG